MGNFAVIDTETNWIDQVMSIGVVVADMDTFKPLDAKYHVYTPEFEVGGMYEGTLFTDPQPMICTREESLGALIPWLKSYGVQRLFAYNAAFDRNHLPELRGFHWYDIMRLAAYRQFNPCIPSDAECFSTGRMKRGYGVEPMLRMLSGRRSYYETHNALHDALDELKIMHLLGYRLEEYIPLK